MTSDEETCFNCRYSEKETVQKKGFQEVTMRCARHAPTANGLPECPEILWCGDYKQKETK